MDQQGRSYIHGSARKKLFNALEMGNLSSHQPLCPSLIQIVERIQNSGVDYRIQGADEPLVTKDELVGLNYEERKQLMEILKDDLQRKEQQRFKWSNNPEKKLLRLCCSRQGSPTKSNTLPERRSKGSMRCRCPAHVSCTESNLIFNLMHVEECLPDAGASEHSSCAPPPPADANVFSEITEFALNLLRQDTTLRRRNLRSQIAGKLEAAGQFSESRCNTILAQVYSGWFSELSPQESLKRMLDELKTNGQPHVINVDTKPNGVQALAAVHLHIREIAPPKGTPLVVFSADVTHGIVDRRSGFTKTSMISVITPSHDAYPVVVTLLESESFENFTRELLFLLDLHPEVRDEKTVWLVDGDQGRIKAIKTHLPLATVHLCLWHKQENIKDHFNPALKAQGGGTKTRKQLMEQLDANGVKYKKSMSQKELQETWDGFLSKANRAASDQGVPSVQDSAPAPASGTEAPDPINEDWDDHADEEELSLATTLPTLSSTGVDVIPATCPPVKALNFVTARQLFRYLRGGKDKAESENRLDEVALKFPKLVNYINRELRSTIAYWADWARVWRLTFGLETSTLQENVHWTLKSGLRGNCVPAHLLVGFLKKQMTKRQIRIDDRFRTSITLDGLIRDLSSWGFAAIVDVLRESPPRRTQFQLLQNFYDSTGYAMKELVTHSEVMESIPLDRRGASAYRFSMLLPADATAPLVGRYFQVTKAQYGTVDVVHVTVNGSFACTCPEVACRGAPDKHVLAVIRNHLAALNPLVHLHPIYLEEQRRQLLQKKEFKSWTAGAPGLVTSVSEAAAWDECVLVTEKIWQHKGEGRAEMLCESPQRQNVNASVGLTLQQRLKKILHETSDKVQDHPDWCIEIIEDLEERLRRFDESLGVVQEVDGRRIQLPVPKRRKTSKRMTMSSDHRSN